MHCKIKNFGYNTRLELASELHSQLSLKSKIDLWNKIAVTIRIAYRFNDQHFVINSQLREDHGY